MFRGNLIFLNEYITFRTFEKLTNPHETSEKILKQIQSFFCWLESIYFEAGLNETTAGFAEQPRCLLESFHWNAYVRGLISKEVFECIENSLKGLGVKAVLLTLSENRIKDRSVVETRKYRTEGWTHYLKTLGSTDEEISAIFSSRQNELCQLYRESPLDKAIINTDEKQWEEYVKVILYDGDDNNNGTI